ncbi:helix-turn-helix transcriptional regulator [Streptosporangium saharense]|uniref:helix-turn-helix transcriptional regulator n=1 Tax=Streptosporangium saharense TaxID=1706840 RepID=UPI00369B9B88
MGSPPKMTIPTQLVLRAFLDDPTREMYGLEICAAAGLASGTIHPILARFEGIGWLESRFEEIDPRKAARPRRRYYRLTADGIELARPALERAHTKAARLTGLRSRLAGGAA